MSLLDFAKPLTLTSLWGINPLECSACGSTIQDAKFCANCGAPAGASTSAPPVSPVVTSSVPPEPQKRKSVGKLVLGVLAIVVIVVLSLAFMHRGPQPANSSTTATGASAVAAASTQQVSSQQQATSSNEQSNGNPQSGVTEDAKTYVFNKHWRVQSLPCDYNGGAYTFFDDSHGEVLVAQGKPVYGEAEMKAEYTDVSASGFTLTTKFYANDLVAKALNDRSAISATKITHVTLKSGNEIEEQSEISTLNLDAMQNGVKKYDVKNETTTSTACPAESAPSPQSQSSAETTSPAAAPATYTAYLTCEGPGQMQANVAVCFMGPSASSGTALELRNGDDYGLYKTSDMVNDRQRFSQSPDGTVIHLKNHFEIKAQNASNQLILGLRIVDDSNRRVVFNKKVAQYDVISVSN